MDVHSQRVQWLYSWVVAGHTWYPPGSILEPMLFNIFIIDIDSGIEYTIGMFADNTKLSGAVDTIQGRDTIQRGLDVLKKCAHKNLMRFNKVCLVPISEKNIYENMEHVAHSLKVCTLHSYIRRKTRIYSKRIKPIKYLKLS